MFYRKNECYIRLFDYYPLSIVLIMLITNKILTNFNTNSASFENLYSSHDSKCDYAKRPFRTFDAAKRVKTCRQKSIIFSKSF